MFQADRFNDFTTSRKKFPSSLRAIFYDLGFKKDNSVKAPIAWSIMILLIFLIGFFNQSLESRFMAYGLCLVILVLPFAFATIRYWSRLIITDKGYCVSFLGFKYQSGKLTDIIEIRRLQNWNGSFRVKTVGFSDISGFLLFTDELPEPLKNFKMAEGEYFIKQGRDVLVSK